MMSRKPLTYLAGAVVADKAYDADTVLEKIADSKAKAVIP